MIKQQSLMKLFLCVAVLFGFQTLTGCHTPQTETYGGGQRKADVPPAEETKHEMAAVKSRADKDMAAVLTEFEDLHPKPIIALSAEEAGRNPHLPMPWRHYWKSESKVPLPCRLGRPRIKRFPVRG